MKKFITTLILVAVTMGIFAKQPEEKFWKWFVKNQQELFSSEDNNAPIIQELSDKLSIYEEGIVFELSGVEDSKREFVLSADGIQDKFPKLIALYNQAPKLKKWEIIAFRPRMNNFSSIKLNFAGKEFDPKKIWIYPKVKEDNFDLIVYHPDFTQEDKNLITSGMYILLDTALGEYDVVTGIRYLDFQRLPENPAAQGLLPFVELRQIFDEFQAKKTH